MSIKDFQSTVNNKNDALFNALRRINDVPNPQRLLTEMDELALGWEPWKD